MSRASKTLAIATFAAIVLLLAGCSAIFPTGPVSSSNPTPTPSAPNTSTAATATTPAESATLIRTAFAPSPKPRSADPVLKHGSWGIHSGVDFNDTDGKSSKLNSDVRLKNLVDLVVEQRKSLLSIFKSSPGVHKLIAKAGGSAGDAVYTVQNIDAHADTARSTPWVTATFRATFPSEGGKRAVEVSVYRQKTGKGLDNTPYVSGTSVGYIAPDGTIANPSSPAFPR